MVSGNRPVPGRLTAKGHLRMEFPRAGRYRDDVFVGSRRGRRAWVAIAALALLLFLGAGTLISWYVEELWFDSLGYGDVFWTTITYKTALFWGVALLGLGKFKDAVTMFSRALRYDPGFTLALARRGYAYLNLGLAYYPQAALDLQAAVKNDATLVEAWYNLGILHTRQGNDAEVVKMLTQVLELQPDNYAAHFDLAEALLRLGNPQAAAEHFQRVLELAPAESPEFKQSQIELDKLNNNPGV